MPRAKGKKLSQMIDNTVVYGDKFGDIGGSAGSRIKRGGSGVARNKVGVNGDPFGAIGNLSPGTRIKRGRNRITEDDPRWKGKR